MRIVGVIIILMLILVVPHEFGHFIAARIFGVKAREFSIGMGPQLISIRGKRFRGPIKIYKDNKGLKNKINHKENKSEEIITDKRLEEKYEDNSSEQSKHYDSTEFSIRVFPIGGFVQLDEDDRQSDYSKLSRWKKCIVLSAGAIMNFLTAFIMIIIMAIVYRPLTPTMIVSKVGDSMQNSGIKVGDEIIAVDNKEYSSPMDLLYGVGLSDDNMIEVKVIRNNEEVILSNVELELEESQGVRINNFDCKFYGKEMNILNGIEYTFSTVKTGVYQTYLSLKMLVTGEIGVKAMSSIVGVGDMIGKQASIDMYSTLYLIAFVLINVGLFNLLPIPALDGGHIMVNIIEGITRRDMKESVVNAINAVFLIAIMILSVLLMGKDLISIIKFK